MGGSAVSRGEVLAHLVALVLWLAFTLWLLDAIRGKP